MPLSLPIMSLINKQHTFFSADVFICLSQALIITVWWLILWSAPVRQNNYTTSTIPRTQEKQLNGIQLFFIVIFTPVHLQPKISSSCHYNMNRGVYLTPWISFSFSTTVFYWELGYIPCHCCCLDPICRLLVKLHHLAVYDNVFKQLRFLSNNFWNKLDKMCSCHRCRMSMVVSILVCVRSLIHDHYRLFPQYFNQCSTSCVWALYLINSQ